MGDISELRGLVVVGSFITVTILLMMWIPVEFAVSSEQQRIVEPPEYFEAIDISSFAETWSNNFDDGSLFYIGPIGWWRQTEVDGDADGDFGGYDIDFYSDQDKAYNGRIMVRWVWYWWIIPTGSKSLTWYDVNGFDVSDMYVGDKTLTGDQLNSDYENEGKMEYNLKSGSFTIKVYFNFNTTIYDTPVEAWENDDIHTLFGIEFDQTQTAYSAFDVLAMVLFFNLPDCNWMIKALIAVPIWISVAYLTFILVLRAIGAIFGGGA